MDPRKDPPEKATALAEASDQGLLADYVATHSPAVFRRMVERHGPMVLHTALRVVGNWHDAEDVAQAVFVVLAQRAGSVSSTLVGWLHKVTRDVALQVVRERTRRARREEAAVKNQPTPAPATESAVREELDRALVELPDRLREAVVLRYLEGHGQEEAARMAGCDKGTLSRRCTQGLTRMGALLARRGVAVAPVVLAGFLANQAAGSVSAATLTALGGVAAGGAGNAHAAALAQGAVKAMFWAKTKMCAGLVAAVTTVAAAGAVIPLVLPTHGAATTQAAPKEVLLRLDFEDGQLPAICTVGQVVKGPERPGNRFCLEGGPFAALANKGKVFLEKAGGVATYSEDLALVFDLWVDARVSTVDLHLWNQTQQASQGVEPLRVAREQWLERVVVRFRDFKHGSPPVGPKPGDIFSSLAIQTGQQNGTLFIDNLEIVRLPTLPAPAPAHRPGLGIRTIPR